MLMKMELWDAAFCGMGKQPTLVCSRNQSFNTAMQSLSLDVNLSHFHPLPILRNHFLLFTFVVSYDSDLKVATV
jgi:hypothetical protein